MSSCYGGFENSSQETTYNKCVYQLIHALATRFTAALNTSKFITQDVHLNRNFLTIRKKHKRS